MTATTATEFKLTNDQQTAYSDIVSFLMDTSRKYHVISGYAGCGKSTLVKYLLDQISNLRQTINLLKPNTFPMFLELTATTNKAAENLEHITNNPSRTIHSLLGLVVSYTDEGKTKLLNRRNVFIRDSLIIIDEASYIDSELLQQIDKQTLNCKIIFIGDPAQLTPIKSKNAPVFTSKITTSKLEEVVRQNAGNPIIDLATKFRNTVNTGEFFNFKPDGVHIQHFLRDDFNQVIWNEFSRPDWKYHDSKILAWTNKCVVAFNCEISEHIKGTPDFLVGDYAICNSYVENVGGNLKTDQFVYITNIRDGIVLYGIPGKYLYLDNKPNAYFQPDSWECANAYIKELQNDGQFNKAQTIKQSWIDLRAAYACTVNKSQGSTFDRVFIDLDDIGRCNNGNQIARMLYVAVSRARHQVVFTGDLV